MVDFVSLNEWNLATHESEFDREPLFGGLRPQRYSGVLTENRTFEKRVYNLTTQLMTAAEAIVVRRLLLGYGETFDFEFGEQSHKGMPLGTVGTFSVNTGSGVGGTDSIRVTSGSFVRILDVIDEFYWTGKWTVLFFHKESSEAVGAYEHYGIRSTDSDSQQWKDGVQGSHGINDFVILNNVPGAGFNFEGKDSAGANSEADYDHIMIFPQVLTDAQMEAFTATANTGSRLPNLKVKLAEDSAAIDMVGEVTEIEYVQYEDDLGVWHQDGQRLTVTLEEA